jgi:hypothetical protein
MFISENIIKEASVSEFYKNVIDAETDFYERNFGKKFDPNRKIFSNSVERDLHNKIIALIEKSKPKNVKFRVNVTDPSGKVKYSIYSDNIGEDIPKIAESTKEQLKIFKDKLVNYLRKQKGKIPAVLGIAALVGSVLLVIKKRSMDECRQYIRSNEKYNNCRLIGFKESLRLIDEALKYEPSSEILLKKREKVVKEIKDIDPDYNDKDPYGNGKPLSYYKENALRKI